MATKTKSLKKRAQEITKDVPVKKIVYGTSAVVGVGALYFLFRKTPIPFSDTPLPDGEVDEQKVKQMASELYEVLDRYIFNPVSSARCDTLRVYEKFTNAEFVAVANFYQKKYRKTIRQSIEGTLALLCFDPDPVEHIYIRFRELNIP